MAVKYAKPAASIASRAPVSRSTTVATAKMFAPASTKASQLLRVAEHGGIAQHLRVPALHHHPRQAMAQLPQSVQSQGVTVNNLLPGAFDTDRLKTTLAGAAEKTGQSVDAIADARRKGIPAKRFGTSEEFGAICAFLCSAHAGYITGQNVLADGGAYPGTF